MDKKQFEKNSRKNSMHSIHEEEDIFDSPYDQLYFQNFTMFLEELIKSEFPKKAEIYENNVPEFELTFEERNSFDNPKNKKNEG